MLQVGGIKPGCFLIGNTGGMLDNIVSSMLYRPGSVAYTAPNHAGNALTRTLALDGRPFSIASGHIDNGIAWTALPA